MSIRFLRLPRHQLLENRLKMTIGSRAQADYGNFASTPIDTDSPKTYSATNSCNNLFKPRKGCEYVNTEGTRSIIQNLADIICNIEVRNTLRVVYQ